MRANYETVTGYGESEIIISKSRFLTFIDRVETEQQALDFINNIKKKHYQATHNCSAYLIGEHDTIQKANDDGEPSGTAGVPMLEVLKKQGLKDVVVVVTRYFGGIKLGSGGLIRAYGKATTEGIKAAGVVARRKHRIVRVTADYTWLGKLENEIRNSTYTLRDIVYAENVELIVATTEEEKDTFADWITELTNGQALTVFEEIEFVEFPLT
ncbi:YigZ family protein [Metalysinibacillus jejuensis]|uniref:YigZ family protein n=1 Tax=Metalysinibacillus jejuensis TaxID=914327 RepID=UPI000D34ECD1|nr:YigZ family protein [Metalysinibacillus jejuensis]